MILLNVNAQTDKSLKIGFFVAPGFARLNGNEILNKNTKAIFSYSTGVSFLVYLKENISLYGAVSYEKKGYVYPNLSVEQNGIIYDNVKIFSGFNYMTLPILLRSSIGKKRNFFIAVGPYLGYLLSHNIKVVGSSINNSSNNTDGFKKIDIGLTNSIGVDFPINKRKSFSMELRNNIGLKNISKIGVVNDGKIKTNSLNLILSYNITASKK